MEELFHRAANVGPASYRDLHIILDAVPVPLSWAEMPGGEIRFVNRAFKRTFGYSDDAFRTVLQWVEHAYPREADRAQAAQHWEGPWTKGGSGSSEIAAMELVIRCADGSLLTVQHRGVVLHDIGIAIATFEDISARKQAEDALFRIAFQDPLTGAGNRRALQARWLDETSPATGDGIAMLAVLLVDLDDFKPINDRMGHDVGDAVLAAVADRLRSCIRENDLLFRIGGDEFVILLPGQNPSVQVEALCTEIGRAFAAAFRIEEQDVRLGASIGASLFPQDGIDLRDILKQADQALYRAKKQGKGRWAWFSTP